MSRHLHNFSDALSITTSSVYSQLDLSILQSIQTSLFALKAVSQQKNILPKCRQYFQILTLLKDSCQPNEHFTDSNAHTFFFSEFLVSNTQFILECFAVENRETEIMLNSCLKQTLKLVTKRTHIEGDHLWQVLEFILNPKQPYYQCNSRQKELPIIADVQSLTQNDKEAEATKSIGFYFFESVKKEIVGAKFLDIVYNLVKKSHLSFNAIVQICSIMNHLPDSCGKYITTEYISKVHEAILDSLVNNTELQRDGENGLTDKNIKALLRGMKTLLKKSLNSLEEKHKVCDTLKLQIAIICLGSEALNNKKWGRLIVNDVVSEFKRSKSNQLKKSLSKPACDQLLCSAFRKIFESPNLSIITQLSKCCLKLLSYMFKRNLFANATELEILWNYLKGLVIFDQHLLRDILHNIFKGFPCSDLKVLLRIINENIDQRTLQILSLIGEKYDKNKTLTCIFQSILEDNDGINKGEWFKDVFKKYKMSYLCSTGYKEALGHIEDHIANTRKNPSKFGCFRMIMLWAGEVLKTKDNNLIQRLLKIYTEQKVLELFLIHLRSAETFVCPQNNNILPGIFGNEHEKPNQLAKVSEQIAFLEHLLHDQMPEKPVLTYVIMSKFWEIFVEYQQSAKVKTLFFKAMTRVNNSKNRLCLPEGDMQKFFQRKIASDKMKVNLVSVKGTRSCFISFFSGNE